MRLNIVCKNAELTDELKVFAQEKIDRLEKFFDGVMKAQLILSPDFVTSGAPSAAMPPEDSGASLHSRRSDRRHEHAAGADTGNCEPSPWRFDSDESRGHSAPA